MRRPLSTWVLLVALVLMVVGATVAGNELRVSTQQKAVGSAELNADTVMALTVGRTLTSAKDLATTEAISTDDAMGMQTDVSRLSRLGLLEGLEVWRLDGSLVFADASHPRAELHLPTDEARRALAGGFTQPGAPTEQGIDTWEVFRLFDGNEDGRADAIVEVALPAKGQAHVEMVTRRLYGALLILVLLVAVGLFRFNRRLRRREFEATHDSLTGLANRQALGARDDALSRSSTPMAALILLDLDGLKAVNDTLGHYAGDDLLVQVARTLESLVCPSALVARLGGDEFAVLLAGPQSRQSALSAATTLIAGLAKRGFCVDGVLLDVHASAGVALRPDDATTIAGLLQRADVAMYQAKKRGAGALAYDADEDPHDVPKLQLLAQLRHAIDREELLLDYQPKIDLRTGEVCGVEALVRWQHPERGLLPPDTFVPIAEYTALIAPLTDWVLGRACRQAAAWREAGMPLAVAVNVSPRSLLNGDLPALVQRVLASTGLPAALLELEITETAMVVDPVRAREVLLRLRTMGVSVSLDDFGTGFTSLIMLQTLPVTALKIDRAFVTGMLAGREDSAVAESLIALAGRLGLVVVAEGVESAHVLNRLRTLGCDQAQGFHLARPLPATEVPACVQARAVVMA